MESERQLQETTAETTISVQEVGLLEKNLFYTSIVSH